MAPDAHHAGAMADELVGLAQLAHRLRVPSRWLRDEVAQGRLPALEAGGQIFFNQELVERCLLERASQGHGPAPGGPGVIHVADLITLTEARALLPGSSRPAVSTLWRWALSGLKGVRLEYVRAGRRVLTSRRALEEFLARFTEADRVERDASAPRSPTPARRAAEIAAAEAALDLHAPAGKTARAFSGGSAAPCRSKGATDGLLSKSRRPAERRRPGRPRQTDSTTTSTSRNDQGAGVAPALQPDPAPRPDCP